MGTIATVTKHTDPNTSYYLSWPYEYTYSGTSGDARVTVTGGTIGFISGSDTTGGNIYGSARGTVGDRYVMEELTARGWLYGGESSGHIIALDRQTTGDGIVSALQILAAIRSSGKSLAELTADISLMPQALVNKRIPKGYDWKSNEAFMAAVKKSELEVEGRGRVLIRPSGTEPLLRIMVECSDPELASDLAHRMADALAV